jgi:ribosomal protein S17
VKKVEKERQFKILMALVKYRLKDLHLRDLEPKILKARIGDAVKKEEFSQFSKEELLEVVKIAATEKLEEIIRELEEARFTS